MHAVILPGMDGGDRLLDAFRACLPFTSEVIAYPPHELLGYAELEQRVRERLASVREPTLLIAESFSGPLAIRIAADPPGDLEAVVLVATFARAPLPGWLRHVVGEWLFAMAPPRALVRRYFLDERADEALLDALMRAMRAVDPAVMASRVQSLLACDVTPELSRVELPMLRIEGARDRLVPPRSSSWPSMRSVKIDGPHLLLEAAPAECARAILSFLGESGVAPRRPPARS